MLILSNKREGIVSGQEAQNKQTGQDIMKKIICLLSFLAGFYAVIGSNVLAEGTGSITSHTDKIESTINGAN